jgi:hypothetical protein
VLVCEFVSAHFFVKNPHGMVEKGISEMIIRMLVMLVDCWVNIPRRYGIEGNFINKETTSFITLNKVEEKVALHNIKGCPSLLE